MNRTSLSPWRAVLVYTWFDLRSLAPWRLVMMFGLPLLLMVILGLVSWASSGFAPRQDNHVVVAPDAASVPSLALWFADSFDEVEVVKTLPIDVSARMSSGALDLVAVVPADFGPGQDVEIRRGEQATAGQASVLHERLVGWRLSRLADKKLGPPPVLHSGTEFDEPPTAPDLDAILAGIPPEESLPRWMVGMALIGALGTLGGGAAGSLVSKSRHKGFNHVLRVGTPNRVVYLSEMLTGATMMLMESTVWWSIYAVGMLVAAAAGWFDAPKLVDVLVDLPMLAALTCAAFVQTSTLVSMVSQLSEDLPDKMRDQLRTMFLMALMVGFQFSTDVFTAEWMDTLSWIPVVGPLSLWFHHVEAGSLVFVRLLLQWLYLLPALRMGAWLFSLDESPLRYLRRRRQIRAQ